MENIKLSHSIRSLVGFPTEGLVPKVVSTLRRPFNTRQELGNLASTIKSITVLQQQLALIENEIYEP